jgi:hypothetical protein
MSCARFYRAKTTWSVIALSAAVLEFAGGARAQDIFIEGDIVRGNQPGAPGQICVLNVGNCGTRNSGLCIDPT